ncbi:hypothetical protein CC86DRAFT_375087 [Ophiobolus disseminans]|uniref:Uncharacterized protein n=1 Tax=Ophiobolus disseminans TaxID=1469910 RepID=A0A6A6ZFW3_9PLEO|nr:hypothetical protein CC86DRAFT_375087 [Ophiobolus disseminans]
MAAGTATQLPLDLVHYQDITDDPDIDFVKTHLQAIADGTKEAAEAAQDLDAWVTGKSTRRLKELRSRPELIEWMAHGSSSPSTSPNASGYVGCFFQVFPGLCTIFPPHHAGQTRVVAFLETLMEMPTHQVPELFPNVDDLSKVDNVALWPRGSISPQPFRVHAARIDHMCYGSYASDSEASVRCRNYQHTLARITMAGIVDCSFLCDLDGILPSSKKYTLPTHKVQSGTRPADIGGRICAAVQWLLDADKARWVYQRCNEKEKTDKANPWDMWSKEHWSIWKTQLKFYQGDDRVEPAAREAARKALERMAAVEA